MTRAESGGGDVVRQLGHIGITLRHEQSALEEYAYHVKDLTVDLQDGVRLCKLAELLTKDTTLMGTSNPYPSNRPLRPLLRHSHRGFATSFRCV